MRVLVLLLALAAGLAQAQSPLEALTLLRRMQQATEKLSYTGTFVYQQGERNETSRITHLADAAGGVDRLEVLDGLPREIVRTRDSIRCYLPESHVVKVERRTDARVFPSLLPEDLRVLAQHYVISLDGRSRVAGLDCDGVLLAPRDELRYGQRFCADAKTGMLLKARVQDAQGRMIEQFTFLQISIGKVGRDKVKPSHAARGWRVEETSALPADLAAAGWDISSDLPGFRKVAEVRRRLRESGSVGQVVYSDGLAAVSVFVEPLAGRTEPVRPGLSNLGAINIMTREVAEHLVTVVGETPATSVQRIANRVTFKIPQ
ncbi:MAG: hypothetical protein A3I63_06365 [Betaproteobacteria bacterium RIFCSPLOWO2_02_FULL_66_14]|nr:MAG: hypothetical protein A3I63_06365 [Betaproteobacteria bacterium RIFCSPLOWO2_02_FULL_66_14]